MLDPSADESYATVWADDLDAAILESHYEQIAIIWAIINEHRTIGPSIVFDMLRHLQAWGGDDTTEALTSAVITLVYPQMEGLTRPDQEELLADLGVGGEATDPTTPGHPEIDLELDTELLREKAKDMFGIRIQD